MKLSKNKVLILFLLISRLSFSQEQLSPNEQEGSVVENTEIIDKNQEESTAKTADEKQENTGEITRGQLENATRLLDIKTSSYSDLLDMCYQLGIQPQGDIEALRKKVAEYYGLDLNSVIGGAVSKDAKKITIQSAQRTEYVSAKTESDEEIISLSGNVLISISENNKKSTIEALDILFNRKSNILFARGNIKFSQEGSSGDTKVFTGEALLFDINKSSGVFLDGITEYNPGKSDSNSFIISADTIGTESESTMVFTDSTLTTCDAEDPHWKIDASKIWLLPGNDFAVLNGIMYVGSLPVFYIPFLYYPTAEMVFHPVFGNRTREGYFLQTTTYLIGRKQPSTDTENGLFNLFQTNTNTEQELEGLFFRNTGRPLTNTSTDYLKIMLDLYSSLGGMAGIEGKFTKSKIFPEISFSLGLGFSRTLVPSSTGGYTHLYTGKSDWNSSNFLGFKLPFRYNLKYNLRMSLPGFNLNITTPIVSDPYFTSDFNNRSEDLNWLKLLTSMDEEETTSSSLTSLNWKLSASGSIPTGKLSPWINSFNFSTIESSVSLYSKTDTEKTTTYQGQYDPGRTFFYPSTIVPFNIKMSVSGTLLKSQSDTAAESEDSKYNDLIVPPVSPWEEEETETEKDTASKENLVNIDNFFPSLNLSVTNTDLSNPVSWNLGYTFSPYFSSELKYNSTNWKTTDDLDWTDIASSYITTGADFSLSGSLSKNPWISASSTLSLDTDWYHHPYLSEKYYTTKSSVDSIRKSDFQSRSLSLITKESLSFKPFSYFKRFSSTSLNWNFSGKLVKSQFNNDVDNPQWDFKYIDWDKNTIDSHSASMVLAADFLGFTQQLSVTSNLPPRDSSFQGNLKTGISNLYLTMSSRVYENSSENDWKYDPLSFSLYFKPFNGTNTPVFQENLVYLIEEDVFSSFTSSVSWGKFAASFKMINSLPYYFSETEGMWETGETEKFLPSEFTMSYSDTLSPLYFWKNRIKINLGLSTNIRMNLLRLTESSFSFQPNITVNINDFLNFTFSSLSTNNVIARYFDKIPLFGLPDLPGESNPLVDLAKSFFFWDENARKMSGFKLKSLNFKLTHNLHDWDLTSELTVKPVLKNEQGRYFYKYEPYFTFMVSWKPVSDLKTQIDIDEGTFELVN